MVVEAAERVVEVGGGWVWLSPSQETTSVTTAAAVAASRACFFRASGGQVADLIVDSTACAAFAATAQVSGRRL